MEDLWSAFHRVDSCPRSIPPQRSEVMEDIDARSWLDAQGPFASNDTNSKLVAPASEQRLPPMDSPARVPVFEYRMHFTHRQKKIVAATDGSNGVAPLKELGMNNNSKANRTYGWGLPELRSTPATISTQPLIEYGTEEETHQTFATPDKKQPVHLESQALEDQATKLQTENQTLKESNRVLQLKVNELKASIDQAIDGRSQVPKYSKAEQDLIENRRAISRSPFVYVLIDGNSYSFLPYYLAAGYEGGKQAAQEMHKEIHQFLKQCGNVDCTLITQIFVDFDELSSQSGTDLGNIRRFSYGFSHAHHSSMLVDSKHPDSINAVSTLFQLFVDNVHCRGFFLGCGSRPNSSGLLDTSGLNPCVADNIVLIDTYPASDPSIFSTMRLRSLFQYGDHFRGNATEKTTAESNGISSDCNSLSLHQNSSFTSEVPAPPQESSKLGFNWNSTARTICLNINKERIDPPLPKVPPDIDAGMEALGRGKHFCHSHHLQGYCGNKNCQYRHDGPLTKMQKVKIQQWCRRTKCRKGLECCKPDCPYGHNCPNLPACQFRNCVFAETHGMDANVVELLSI